MIDIKENCNGFSSGFIFKLEKKSDYSGVVSVDNFTKATFVRNSLYIYLNSASRLSCNDLNDKFESVQIALDYLSLRDILNASIRIPFEHYIFWKETNNDYSIQLIYRVIYRSGVIGDISKLEASIFHGGFRFYRSSQITHDLLDAYRYIWLSFESLITTHVVRKTKPGENKESELEWYRRAVRAISIAPEKRAG